MTEPLFTVVVPLYNKEKYIINTINNVLSQTISDFELIVIDDGSTDNSLNIVKQVTDSRVKYYHQENGGVSKARNNGISLAKGKYIAFLDADDEWTNDFLETCLSLFRDFPTSKMVCPSYQMKYANRLVTPKWRSVSTVAPSLVRDFFEMATAPCWIMNSSCVAIDRQALHNMDYWFPEHERVYEDFDLWLRLGAQYPVAHSHKICSFYNRISESNARNCNKIVYSQTFMDTIDKLNTNPNYTTQQHCWLKEIKDRRMIPYIYSLLLTGNRKLAKTILLSWFPCNVYKKYKYALLIALYFPHNVILTIQALRLKIF